MKLLSLHARKLSGFVLYLLLTTAASSALFAQPSARSSTAMAFDGESGQMVLFGGLSAAGVVGNSTTVRFALGDTWIWTGRRWIQIFPQTPPPARSGAAMEFDSNRDRLVLFGGQNDKVYYNDTWIYQGKEWTKLEPPQSPTARHHAASAFDPIRDRLMIFGGTEDDVEDDGANHVFDTWAFDGTTWSQVAATGPELLGPSMVFDEARDKVYLLGRQKSDGKSEMYEWNGSGWVKLNPAKLPECVSQSQVVYERHTQKVIQFGGQCATGIGSGDTMEWDGTTWTKVESAKTGAGFSYAHAMEYDDARNEIVLFGGLDASERPGTFRYRDGIWSVKYSIYTPGPRSLEVFVHDDTTGDTWMYGGLADGSLGFDLWRFSHNRWQRVIVSDTPTCAFPAATWDSDRKRIVMVCEDGLNFEFEPATLKWYKFENLKDKPDSRRFASIVYDKKNKKTVLFGGVGGIQYLRDTWTWDGQKWTELPRRNPPKARMHAIAFWDPIKEKVTLFGGIGRPNRDDAIVRYGDMWTFDGQSWVEISPAQKPGIRYAAATAFDPIKNRIVMFGGKSGEEQFLDEQWEWDGTTWAEVEPATRPSARMNTRMVFDTTTNQMLLYGGYAATYFGEVWTLGPNGWEIIPEPYGRHRPTSPGNGETTETDPESMTAPDTSVRRATQEAVTFSW